MTKRKDTPLEKWISAAEAASRLGITSRHVKRLIQSGDLEGRKIVTLWLVNPASVETWTRKRAPNKPKKEKPID
jgi:excisionase family DNA binding protein